MALVRLNDLLGTLLDQYVVFGQVMEIYIDDQFLNNGILDTAAMKPIARCGELGWSQEIGRQAAHRV